MDVGNGQLGFILFLGYVFEEQGGGVLGMVRAGNEPSYSGSARARLEKSLARAQLVS